VFERSTDREVHAFRAARSESEFARLAADKSCDQLTREFNFALRFASRSMNARWIRPTLAHDSRHLINNLDARLSRCIVVEINASAQED
jgi:hypothetical protein